jgi:hypothetical protein
VAKQTTSANMNFDKHFQNLETLAENKLSEGTTGMTSTNEIAAKLAIPIDESVGVYEASRLSGITIDEIL